MKKAVAYLTPYLEEEKLRNAATAEESRAPRILMATVKGDVHDIGKNIVGVVLACNNFDIIDMGVMVPAEKILLEAKARQVDMIGLSGLITPSLDEMVHVAKEMERQGFTIPLLIGGATTSRTHTAVKISPHYSGPVVHVLDASRSVPVAGKLASAETLPGYSIELRADNIKTAAEYAGRQQQKEYLSLVQAQKNGAKLVFDQTTVSQPKQLGIRVFDDYNLAEIAEYIDWTPFFQTWQLFGKYPAILDDMVVGVEARKLMLDAQRMLDTIVSEQWLLARAVIGIFPAVRKGADDVALQDGSGRELHFLRQQGLKAAGVPNLALADFIADADAGMQDHIGAFAVTAGIGIEEHIQRFERDHDDYSSIMLKALADRLAESFAELMHEKVRREIWGFEKGERLPNDQLIKERYRGIRPAPGYPACPDHTEKATLFELLNVERNTGISITESFAMYPASSVSGWYFAHPDSRYFPVGKIGQDQVEDYARRKGQTLPEAERWLAPLLG